MQLSSFQSRSQFGFSHYVHNHFTVYGHNQLSVPLVTLDRRRWYRVVQSTASARFSSSHLYAQAMDIHQRNLIQFRLASPHIIIISFVPRGGPGHPGHTTRLQMRARSNSVCVKITYSRDQDSENFVFHFFRTQIEQCYNQVQGTTMYHLCNWVSLEIFPIKSQFPTLFKIVDRSVGVDT